MLVGCNSQGQATYDPSLIKELASVQKSDFIQLKDGRLMVVYNIWCETNNPKKCELQLQIGYNLTHEPYRMRLEYWAPQVEKIIRYGDPTWAMLAKKYLDNK